MSDDRVTHQMVEAACRSFIPHWEECTNEVRADVYADMREALSVSLSTLIEEQAARIEELEQKLRTTSLEALAISDTNNEMAVRIAEAEKDYHEERKARYAAQSELIVSQARLSETVKVLEDIVDESEPADVEGIRAFAKAFIITLGVEK